MSLFKYLKIYAFFYCFWLVPATAVFAGVVESNIEISVFEIVDQLRKSDAVRVGVEISKTHRDYINVSDRNRITALVEQHLSDQPDKSYQVISRTSLGKAEEEARGVGASFATFVAQQQIDTVIRINTYDFVGGLKFNLEVAPYGQTTLISSSQQYLLIDSVRALNRFSPRRAMRIISNDLIGYLFDQADFSYTTPFSIRVEEQSDQTAVDRRNSFLRNLVVSEISILWERRFEQQGISALDDSVPGQVEVGPWSVVVKTDEYEEGISTQIQLVRDGYVQTSRVIEIDKTQLDPSFVSPTPDNLALLSPADLKEGLANTSFLARGRAIVSEDLIEQEALTAAKLLARARAISAALDLAPPRIGVVRQSKQIPQLISYLNHGLPYGEDWTVERTSNVIEVQTELKVISIPNGDHRVKLKSSVLRSGDPLEITVFSTKSLYFGLFGWQADGSVVRIFPFRHRDKVRLNDDRPTLLPSKQFGLEALTSIPFDGARSNHEALILITSEKPLNLGRIAKRVAGEGENYLKRGHNDARFFDMLTLQIQGQSGATNVRFVAFQVTN